MKTAVVTGVSSGLGKGTAAVLIRQGWNVFGSVRRTEDAAKIQEELGASFTPLMFDVRDEKAIDEAVMIVRNELNGETLSALVNNAGVSYEDPLLVQSINDFRAQLEINLVGMFTTTRAFTPLLGADGALSGPKGRIVNISSVGGKFGPPFLGAYAASKHGVEGFSESLRRELLVFGIDVVVVGPGSIKTAIWDKTEAKPTNHLAGTVWETPFRKFQAFMVNGGRNGMRPEDVGMIIAKALTVPRPKTRYAAVRGEFLNSIVLSLLPKRTVDRLLGKRLGLIR
jgi:NAD(P)-dependent dehydrogenase (short-subunit alcohol dehydrogenase family)